MPRRILLLGALTMLAASAWAALDSDRGGFAVLLAALAALTVGFAWHEAGTTSVKDLALVATLAGVAAAGRIFLAPVPGVQPVTVIAIVAGVALGPRRGFAVGALAALVSNFLLGQGVWTPWQMLAWGACGLVGGIAARFLRGRIALAAAGFVLGLAFSSLMDVWEWYSFYPHTWQALAFQMGRGFPFGMAHAIGNVVIALAIGPELRRVIDRYERRSQTDIVWT